MKTKSKNTIIVVLGDGETWMQIEGSYIASLSPSQIAKLDNGFYPKHLRIKKHSLTELVNLKTEGEGE